MKIISKFKDYYDYLQGIYGMDEKLVLERNPFYVPIYIPFDYTIVRFWICDYLVEGMWFNKKVLYGKELEGFHKNLFSSKFHSSKDFYYTFYPPNRKNHIEILKTPTLFKDLPEKQVYFKEWKKEVCPNEYLDCPLLIQTNWSDSPLDMGTCSKFPILSEFDFHKVFTAFQMWTMLTEWLGREKNIADNRTNKERILSNGFDLQTSFRHPVK